MILQKGTPAPDFELNCTPDQTLKLSDFKGKRIILAFYPADWSPVCSDEMSLYNETRKIFEKYNADVMGISVDSKWSHMAFAKAKNIHFPLLADFEPKGKVSKEYGAYNEEKGISKRALFIIDENGVIAWSYLSPEGINPGADIIIDQLEKMTNNNDNK